VNEGVPIGSILMPSSHQKSTRFESVARADPSNTRTTNNPNMRAIATITTALAPPHRGRTGITPSPFNPYTTTTTTDPSTTTTTTDPSTTTTTTDPSTTTEPPPVGGVSAGGGATAAGGWGAAVLWFVGGALALLSSAALLAQRRISDRWEG